MLRRDIQILLHEFLEVLLISLWFLNLIITPGKNINKNQSEKKCMQRIYATHTFN